MKRTLLAIILMMMLLLSSGCTPSAGGPAEAYDDFVVVGFSQVGRRATGATPTPAA